MAIVREMRIFVRIGVLQQDPFLMTGQVLMLIRVLDGNEFLVAFDAFVQRVLLAAAAAAATAAVVSVRVFAGVFEFFRYRRQRVVDELCRRAVGAGCGSGNGGQ